MDLFDCVLYRHHFTRYQELLVKDISRLGRSPNNVVLVDAVEGRGAKGIGVSQQINILNLLPISLWKGQSQDREILDVYQEIIKII